MAVAQVERSEGGTMSYGIGATVEVTTIIYLGRWIYPFEKGEVIGKHCSPAGQEVYDVRLQDGKEYTFAPSGIEEINAKVRKLHEPGSD